MLLAQDFGLSHLQLPFTCVHNDVTQSATIHQVNRKQIARQLGWMVHKLPASAPAVANCLETNSSRVSSSHSLQQQSRTRVKATPGTRQSVRKRINKSKQSRQPLE